MKSSIHILTALMFIGAFLSGCAGSPDEISDMPENTDPGIYVRLTMAMDLSTRSNPAGGEDGDGREEGVRNENRIESLAFFVYNHKDGVNAPDETPIRKAVFYEDLRLEPGSDGTVSYVAKLNDYNFTEGDRVVVALNLDRPIQFPSNLGEVKRLPVANAWHQGTSLSTYSHFTMSTASSGVDDGKVVFEGHDGTEGNPYVVRAEVERLAARVDLMFDNENIAPQKDELVYFVKGDRSDALMEEKSKVCVTHVAVVNSMLEPSWLLKHVSEGMSEDKSCLASLKVCGDELTDGFGYPQNYVVEPLTELKGNVSEAQSSSWFGKSSAAYIRENTETFFDQSCSIGNFLKDDLLIENCGDSGFDKKMTLAYSFENTHHMEDAGSEHVTGLVYRAIYVPSSVYSDISVSEIDGNYKKGDDFWRYSPTSVAMNRTELYFSTEQAALGYRDQHPEDRADVSYYKGGVCYYNLWIKHANVDGGNTKDFPSGEGGSLWPMEYGIVRNNIYRVGVSFTGIGTPKPEIREPKQIETRIYTRKWNFRRQPVIIM